MSSKDSYREKAHELHRSYYALYSLYERSTANVLLSVVLEVDDEECNNPIGWRINS